MNIIISFKNTLRSLLLVHVLIAGGHGQLTAKDASEGSCLWPFRLLPHLYKGVNPSALTLGDYYIPMASEALYRQYAEALLGRPAAAQYELDAMNLVVRFGPAIGTIQNIGFPYMKQPPRFNQTCIAGGLPSSGYLRNMRGKRTFNYVQAVCVGGSAKRPDGNQVMEASRSFSVTLDSIIWVNPDQTAYLIYRCPADGIKDYKVVSKTKYLKKSDIQQIKEKILPLGFHESRIAYMKYNY